MNAAIYVRLSTDKQEAEGHSLPTQEAACRKYAVEQGLTVAEVSREVHTASELYERPELARCREALARGVTLRALGTALSAEGVATPSGRAQLWQSGTSPQIPPTRARPQPGASPSARTASAAPRM